MKENIKLICFDLDETLINRSSWKYLSMALGMTEEEDRKMYKDYKAGLFSYDEWNEKILKHYLKHKDATKEGITNILSRYDYIDGAKEAVKYLQSKGYKMVLISGSMDILVKVVAEDLGIDYYKANNTFVFDENNKLKGIHSGGDDTIAKLGYLESFCEMLGVNILSECVCIGDGSNDLMMFEKTQHGITFRNSKIKDTAWKLINSLHEIKEIL